MNDNEMPDQTYITALQSVNNPLNNEHNSQFQRQLLTPKNVT